MLTYNPPVLVPAINVAAQWDGINWLLADDWQATFKNQSIRLELTIKQGFKTDGGSIPSIFQNLYHPLGSYLIAFLIHDALYATEYFKRSEADLILLEVMQALGANWLYRNSVWAAVKLGGWFAWANHTTKSIANARQLISHKVTNLKKKGIKMDIGTTVAIIVAVGEFVAICFMTPMIGKVGKIEEKLIEMDKKLMSNEELDKAIDLKIYGHMSKCHAHNTHHRVINPKTE